ncbi:hypothetical protein [Vibrio cincinnatiensis]|uniref:hypothetical protein n=1 Tax=Vibrio cincinnatiensis TaxID=675 RepID=UPI001FA99391
MLLANKNKSVWFVYIASLLTPLTCLLSSVIAIIYAGYRLDKDQDGEVANSHYYGLIRSFFLFLTFFVVLIVTVATANGVIMGVNRYWFSNAWLAAIGHGIPYLGALMAVGAITLWIFRMIQGMKQLQANIPHQPSKGPNL